MDLFKKIKQKLVKTAREAWLSISFRAFGYVPLSIRRARGLRILVYHGACPGDPHRFNARYVSAPQFEAHLQLIKSLYNPVSYNDLITGKLSKDRLNVLLTFDDGLKNNHALALPLLKKHGVPALFFVTALAPAPYPYIFNDLTDLIPAIGPDRLEIDGQLFYRKKIFLHQRYVNAEGESLAAIYHGSSWQERQQVMKQLLSAAPPGLLASFAEYYHLVNDEEIREIAATKGMAIGAHGAYHTALDRIRVSDAVQEIKTSAAYLEKIIQTKVDCMAFPYGAHNQEIMQACSDKGFRHCFGTEHLTRAEASVQVYERMTINPYVSAINQMYYTAKNNYE